LKESPNWASDKKKKKIAPYAGARVLDISQLDLARSRFMLSLSASLKITNTLRKNMR
jgi:hypothetical protein